MFVIWYPARVIGRTRPGTVGREPEVYHLDFSDYLAFPRGC